jgi:hypothetical protein
MPKRIGMVSREFTISANGCSAGLNRRWKWSAERLIGRRRIVPRPGPHAHPPRTQAAADGRRQHVPLHQRRHRIRSDLRARSGRGRRRFDPRRRDGSITDEGVTVGEALDGDTAQGGCAPHASQNGRGPSPPAVPMASASPL